jgi:hypothetical protein
MNPQPPYIPPPPDVYQQHQPTGFRFSIGDVLGKGFSIYFKNFPAFMVMALICYAPLILYALVAPNPFESAKSLDDLQSKVLIYTLVITVGALICSQFVLSAVTYATVQELRGQHASIGASMSVGLKRLLPTLAVSFVAGLCIVAGLIALVVPGLIVMCMLYVAVPASVVERPGIGGALSRSGALTKGYRWHIFLIVIIIGIIGGVFNYALEHALVDHVPLGRGGEEVPHPDQWKRYMLVNVGGQVITSALGAAMAAAAYVGLRNTKEGVGVDELARVFD